MDGKTSLSICLVSKPYANMFHIEKLEFYANANYSLEK